MCLYTHRNQALYIVQTMPPRARLAMSQRARSNYMGKSSAQLLLPETERRRCLGITIFTIYTIGLYKITHLLDHISRARAPSAFSGARTRSRMVETIELLIALS